MATLKIIVAACMAALFLAAPAYAERPGSQDRKDALKFARAYWEDRGYYAEDVGCDRVRTKLGRGDGNIFGAWFAADPCSIYLNVNAGWDGDGNRAQWWNVCATTIHEYGHLVGKGHSRNPNSVMAKYKEWNFQTSWYPWFPACRYDGDDPDGDGYPDW
jgi:Matrixin